MPNSVFVKVVGFRDSERHALNTVFRLSHERDSHYEVWLPSAGIPPHLLLVDTDSDEGRMELELSGSHQTAKRICVGDHAYGGAWLSFKRPLNWSAVVWAMDQLLGDASRDGSYGPAYGAGKSVLPADTRSALLVDASRDHRLYLRARLALSGFLEVEETDDSAEALSMAQQRHFDWVMVNLDVPKINGWELIDQLVALEPAIGSVFLCSRDASWQIRERAVQVGCAGVLTLPFDPAQVIATLRKI